MHYTCKHSPYYYYKTPNLVLIIVAVTFNTSHIQFIIKYLKANKA